MVPTFRNVTAIKIHRNFCRNNSGVNILGVIVFAKFNVI